MSSSNSTKHTGPSQATILCKLAADNRVELFRHEDEGYASVWLKDHYQTYPTRSEWFRRYRTRFF